METLKLTCNLEFHSDWELRIERSLRRQPSPGQEIPHRWTSGPSSPPTEYLYHIGCATTDDHASPTDGVFTEILLVATTEGKRTWQIALWLLALPLTFHWPNQATRSCLTSKRGGEVQPYYVPGKKGEVGNVLKTLPVPHLNRG